MLKQRVITALILFGAFVWTLSVPVAWPFLMLTLLLLGAAGWEWARLAEQAVVTQWLSGITVAVVSVLSAQATGVEGIGHWLALTGDTLVHVHVHEWGHALAGFAVPATVWWFALAAWVGGGAWALRFGSVNWKLIPSGIRLVFGVGALSLAWLAMAEGKAHGVNFLLSMLFLVWAADVGAYFGGRAFGRRKLAPTISPGKSWEGVWSGFATVLLVAWIWIWVDQTYSVDSPSMYSHLLHGLGPVGAITALLFLTAMSVVGDLFESLIKRQAGVKDSSQLLPGHGGVLDRVDALLPVLPIEMALMSLCHG